MVKVINKPEFTLEVINTSKQAYWPICQSCEKTFNVGDKKIKWRLYVYKKSFSLWNLQCTECARETFDAYTELFASNVINDVLNSLPLERRE